MNSWARDCRAKREILSAFAVSAAVSVLTGSALCLQQCGIWQWAVVLGYQLHHFVSSQISRDWTALCPPVMSKSNQSRWKSDILAVHVNRIAVLVGDALTEDDAGAWS